VLAEEHDLTDVRIWPIGVKSARFSLPCVVEGYRDGKTVRIFAKIVGSSDHFTAVISQFIKNMYLEGKNLPAMFGAPKSAYGMARHQHDRLKEFVDGGILTSGPLGCHELDGIRAMLVIEFVVGKPFTKVEITPALAEAAFGILRRLHDRGLSHGDIKLDNLVLGPQGQLYLLDVGNFREGTPPQQQRAYDIASLLCALSERMPVDYLVDMGVLKYPAADQLAAVPYVELSRNRPDFFLPDEIIIPIQAWLSASSEAERKAG
jgi:serine/threonine protein kinase